jgi:hypothetical protein
VILDTLVDWWRRRGLTAPRIDKVIVQERQGELPESISRHAIAVVGSFTHPKWAALECPCGAGHRLMINLSPNHAPAWRLARQRTRPSLHPSIDFEDTERRCHFWLRDGKVQWCRDSRRGRS